MKLSFKPNIKLEATLNYEHPTKKPTPQCSDWLVENVLPSDQHPWASAAGGSRPPLDFHAWYRYSRGLIVIFFALSLPRLPWKCFCRRPCQHQQLSWLNAEYLEKMVVMQVQYNTISIQTNEQEKASLSCASVSCYIYRSAKFFNFFSRLFILFYRSPMYEIFRIKLTSKRKSWKISHQI